MDAELHIGPPDSDSDLYDDLYETGYPPPEQQVDRSQESRRSRVRLVVSVPQSRCSSSINEISPTPSKTRASSPPSVWVHNTSRHRWGRGVQLHPSSPPTHWQPPSRRRRASGLQTRHPRTPPSPPARQSPRPQSPPDLRNWTVARLQWFLREKGILFQRTDNKAKLFQLYWDGGGCMSPCACFLCV